MEFNSLLRRIQAGFRHLAHGRVTAYVTAAAVFSLALAGAGAVQLRAQSQADLTLSPAPASASASSLPGELPAGGGGAKNIVQVRNMSDGTLKAHGRVQVTSVPAPNFAAANIAIASSSCVNCQTLAVALQINLVSRNVRDFHPQNAAVASNAACTGCDTIAVAFQYNLGVDDPNQLPPEVHQLVTAMNGELARIDNGNVTLAQAEAEIDGVIAQFNALAASLTTQRDEATVPNSPSPSPSPNPSPAGTPTPVGSPSPASGTTTATPSPAISPSPT